MFAGAFLLMYLFNILQFGSSCLDLFILDILWSLLIACELILEIAAAAGHRTKYGGITVDLQLGKVETVEFCLNDYILKDNEDAEVGEIRSFYYEFGEKSGTFHMQIAGEDDKNSKVEFVKKGEE